MHMGYVCVKIEHYEWHTQKFKFQITSHETVVDKIAFSSFIISYKKHYLVDFEIIRMIKKLKPNQI